MKILRLVSSLLIWMFSKLFMLEYFQDLFVLFSHYIQDLNGDVPTNTWLLQFPTSTFPQIIEWEIEYGRRSFEENDFYAKIYLFWFDFYDSLKCQPTLVVLVFNITVGFLLIQELTYLILDSRADFFLDRIFFLIRWWLHWFLLFL